MSRPKNKSSAKSADAKSATPNEQKIEITANIFEEEKRETFAEFAKRNNITLQIMQIPSRPSVPTLRGQKKNTYPGRKFYVCALSRVYVDENNDSIVATRQPVVFTCGTSHPEPTVLDILSCLTVDYTTSSFEEFVDEFGYDNSWSPYRTWQACVRSTEDTVAFFGRKLTEELLNCEPI